MSELSKIVLDIHNVDSVSEADHVITTEDDAKLDKYFEELDGSDHQRIHGIGMTLRDYAKFMDEMFWMENLQHSIICLFGHKYEAYY